MIFWGNLIIVALGLILLAIALVELNQGWAWGPNLERIRRSTEPKWFWFYAGTRLVVGIFAIVTKLWQMNFFRS